MRENVKVSIWGFGAMGSGMAKMLLNKKGVEIVGVCDRNPNRAGKSMYEVLGVERGDRREVIINSNIDEVLAEKCDVCLCATDSFTKNAFPRIKTVLEKKINVISTAEEMAYTQAQNPELAAELDKIAKENGVTVFCRFRSDRCSVSYCVSLKVKIECRFRLFNLLQQSRRLAE